MATSKERNNELLQHEQHKPNPESIISELKQITSTIHNKHE
jgi:hypothetical protein